MLRPAKPEKCCAVQVYAAIKEELATGGRAYIICPLVGDTGSEATSDIKADALSLPLSLHHKLPIHNVQTPPYKDNRQARAPSQEHLDFPTCAGSPAA